MSSDDDMTGFEFSWKFKVLRWLVVMFLQLFGCHWKNSLMSTNLKLIWVWLEVFCYMAVDSAETFLFQAVPLLTSLLTVGVNIIISSFLCFHWKFSVITWQALTISQTTRSPSFLPFYGQREMKCFKALFTDPLKLDWIFKKTNDGEREGLEIIQSWSSISNSFLSFHGTIIAILCNARFFEKSLMEPAENWVVKDSNCNIKFKKLLCRSIYWPLCCHFGFHLICSSLEGCACSNTNRVRISSVKQRFWLRIFAFDLCQLGGFERESTLSVSFFHFFFGAFRRPDWLA